MTYDTLPSIPGYTIERQLGQGGMGAVYLGRAADANNTLVAIKVIRRPIDDGSAHSFITRFKREIEICQGLSHENLVSTISGGISEEGTLYLILEFLQGATLEESVSKERLSEEQAIQLAQKLCDALTCIHSRGLYHRDVKPANILLQKNLEPVLIDFGLALANNRTRLTETGLALGTLQTMAPEQLMGKKLSETADIYSLGATLFFSITGKYPFNEEEIIAVASGMPRRSNLVDKLKGRFSERFIDVLNCALATDPQKRFASAALFKEALSEIGNNLSPTIKSNQPKSLGMGQYPRTTFLPILLCVLSVATILALAVELRKPRQSKSNELLRLRRQLMSGSGMPSTGELRRLGQALVVAGEASTDGALSLEAIGQFDLLSHYLRYKRKQKASQMAGLFIDSHAVSWYSAGRTLPITALSEAINDELEFVVAETTFQQIKKLDDVRIKFKMLPLFTSLTNLLRGPTDFHERADELQRLSVQYCEILEPLHGLVETMEERQHLYECHFQSLKMDLRKPARMKALKLLQKAISESDKFIDIWLIVKYGTNAMLKSTKDNLDDVDTSYHVIAIDALRKVSNKLKNKEQKWEWSMALASQLNRVGKQKEALQILADVPLASANNRAKCNYHFTKAEILLTAARYEEALAACEKALAASDHNKDTIEKFVLRIKSQQVISRSGLSQN